ncbi:MAG: WG repeat-containing protein [Tannerella sp.]|jgi:hypothetical protein|nr:WG repeat-containing protein [Tannerella sp.]
MSTDEHDLFTVHNGDAWMYIDKEGKTVINPMFSDANFFHEGLASVKLKGENQLYGFIDKTGTFIIQPHYKRLTSFSEGVAWVVKENGYPVAINKKGDVLFEMKQAQEVRNFHEGLAAVSILNKNGKEVWGFVNKKGEMEIIPQFDVALDFHQGKAAVVNEKHKIGYIDKTGVLVINYQFDYKALEGYNSFNDNKHAVVSFGGKSGIINHNGQYTVNPQYDLINPDGNIYMISQNKKIGWMDKDGKILINPQFDMAFMFLKGNLAPVQINDQWGYIDRHGKIVINPQFDGAMPFVSSVAIVGMNDLLGLINEKGKIVVNPQFKDIRIAIEGFINDNYNLKTDYLDTDFICGKMQELITPEAFNGHAWDASLSMLKDIYKLSNYSFKKNESYQTLVSRQSLSGDIEYAIVIEGGVWTKEFDGWFDYKEVVNDELVPAFYVTLLDLKGKARGREQFIAAAIYQSFGGTSMDEVSLEEGSYSVSKGQINVNIQCAKDRIIIYAFKKN